ncbi:MAG: hypothetical protein MI923_06590 [Phycisphaerales bacterium]|nr:hypothetical protein [Phycisphaerales bacterium]
MIAFEKTSASVLLTLVPFLVFPLLEPVHAEPREKAASPDASTWRTDLRIDIFEVRLDPDRAGALGIKGLEKNADTIDSLESYLEEHGTTRILHRLAQPVNLEDKPSLIIGSDIPIVTAGPGPSVKNIRLRNVGCRIKLEGGWDEGNPTQGHASLNINLKTFNKSGVAVIDDAPAAVARRVDQKMETRIESGRPLILLSMQADDDSQASFATVSRIVFLRANGGADPTEESTDTAKVQWQTEARVSIYQVDLEPDMLSAMDVDTLEQHAETPKTLHKFLAEHGRTRLMFRHVQPVELARKSRWVIGSQVPIVTRVASKHQNLDYRDLGFVGEALGGWHAQDPRRGHVRCYLELSTICESTIEIAEDLNASVQKKIFVNSGSPMIAGKPIIVFTVDANAVDEKATACVARFEFRRTPIESVDRPGAPVEHGQADARISLLEVTLDPENSSNLTVEALMDHAASVEVLQRRLADYGEARIVSQFAQRVDLKKNTKLQQQSDQPYATGSKRNKAGEIVKIFQTREVGTLVEIEGNWDSGDPRQGRTALKLRASGIRPSSIKVSPGVFAIIYQSLTEKTEATIVAGQPLIFLSTNGPLGYAQVVRVEFLRTTP